MNSRSKQLLLACLVPVLILLSMCVTPVYTLFNGKEIILQTMPVDPSDLFRGDYVTLRYEAEEVPKRLVEKDVVEKRQDGWGELEVYVLLEEKSGIYIPAKVTLEEPDKGIYLKGKLNYIDKNNEGQEIASIGYSLDKYYLEDNTGKDWEKASTQGKILAKIKVNNGYGILTNIEMQ